MLFNNLFSPRLQIFYGESPSDLALMPTTTKKGEGQYINALAPAGSIATILLNNETKVYMLRSTGWIDVTNSQIRDFIKI